MSEKKMTSIGGQAVIEGVMMRGPHKIATAVRKPDGEIIIDEKENKSLGKIAKVPIIRGVIAFISSMVIGVKSLMFSAKFYDVEDENKKDQKKETKENMSDWMIYGSVILAICMSVGLFIVLPNVISNIFVPNKEANPVIYNLVESIVKIIIFLGYLFAVSLMKDIQRTFEYHGAEHKTIFCYENGEELIPENVKKYSRFHPRCGTSFLLFVVIISIIVFSLVGVYKNPFINLGLRLLLLPLVAGISYEIIKFAGRSTSKYITWLNAPGKWLQRLTTREPDEKQIEVAIAALKAVIPENKDDDIW
jgi:uncharacterized protein YqhQ